MNLLGKNIGDTLRYQLVIQLRSKLGTLLWNRVMLRQVAMIIQIQGGIE